MRLAATLPYATLTAREHWSPFDRPRSTQQPPRLAADTLPCLPEATGPLQDASGCCTKQQTTASGPETLTSRCPLRVSRW